MEGRKKFRSTARSHPTLLASTHSSCLHPAFACVGRVCAAHERNAMAGMPGRSLVGAILRIFWTYGQTKRTNEADSLDLLFSSYRFTNSRPTFVAATGQIVVLLVADSSSTPVQIDGLLSSRIVSKEAYLA